MIFPPKLVKKIRLARGPVLLGQPVATPDSIYVGRGTIHRFEAANLRERWNKHHEDCSPALVFGNLLVIGDGVTEAALDTDSGELVWSAHSWGGPMWRGLLLRYFRDAVAFVEPSTGKLLEKVQILGPASFHDLMGDILLLTIGDEAKAAAAFDLTRRKLLWQNRLVEETTEKYQAPGNSVTLEAGLRCFVATKANVGIFGCSIEDGHILWYQRAFVSSDVPIAVDGRVYLLTEDFTPARHDYPKFMCFDELTGEKIYETEHRELRAYRPSRPTVADGHIYFGNNGGFVFAFRLSDGELVWSHRTTGQTWQPTVHQDRVYVTSDDGHLLVFEGRKPTKPPESKSLKHDLP
jgi:outer membrane protein assembly factor BamB